MSDSNQFNAFRFPTSPYPGLRPFLDHEAALFLGRGRQVDDVVRRLKLTQFVAVIGGSGSGKSSLVRAGVVPKLRGYGIPEAGDYWVPVVVTPGTTPLMQMGEGSGEGALPPSQTPITRLAWKFSQQLGRLTLDDGKTLDAERENARRRDIGSIFGRGSGFARLVDAYSEDLPELGPDRKDARFLFVIDQFEELFHPNNRRNEDSRILIEAVIDHFFSPHPRCFVILTMRSEHLADCAGYLELPDAINESVYLVRRPDEGELREAIAGPAKVFLRLLQRGDNPGKLPDEIRFDDAVVGRLLKDVERIADDPDHLPLLQHLLARIWEESSRRCGVESSLGVPDEIQWGDLERGVDPRARDDGWLRRLDAERKPEEAPLNTLRASLENWAQAVYEGKADDRPHIDVILRRLAFKDPNNGTYNQQRLDVSDPGLFAGDANKPANLRALLEKGYLDTVHYLYWDRENPAQVTLKVSHESFIRGWAHFRALIDDEAERFEVFLTVLRRCSDWRDENGSPERLLGQAELIRLDEAKLGSVFSEHDQRDDWFRTLKQYRDGDRLGNVEAEVANYIEASRVKLASEAEAKRIGEERVRKAQEDARLADWRREAESKASKRKIFASVAVLSLVVVFGIPFVLTAPIMGAVENFGLARLKVDQSYRSGSAPVAGDSRAELDTLLSAAKMVSQGKHDASFLGGRFYQIFGISPQIAVAKRLSYLQDTEPYVNGNLRQRLTTALWPSLSNPDAPGFASEKFVPEAPLAAKCIVQTANEKAPSLEGFLYRYSSRGRGIFVPKRDWPQWQDIEFYPAIVGSDGKCVGGKLIGRANGSNDAYVVFDARLIYMAASQGAGAEGLPSLKLFKLTWGDDAMNPSASLEIVTEVFGADVVDNLRKEITEGAPQNGDPKVKTVLSWREVGGIGARVAGHSWRLFASGAQRIPDPGETENWSRPLVAAPEGSDCRLLQSKLGGGGPSPAPGEPTGMGPDMYQFGKHCIQIVAPRPASSPPKGEGMAPGGERPPAASAVVVNVYDVPVAKDLLDVATPTPVANFARFAGSRCALSDWKVGVAGDYEGWLSAKSTCPDEPERIIGAPWSTAALVRLAQEVLKVPAMPRKAPDPAAPSGPSGAR